MATRKKSVNDIEAQLDRIRTMALSRGANQPDEIAIPIYKRYRRALIAARNYQRNISNSKSFRRLDDKFAGAEGVKRDEIVSKQLNRKYSPNTYRGLNKG